MIKKNIFRKRFYAALLLSGFVFSTAQASFFTDITHNITSSLFSKASHVLRFINSNRRSVAVAVSTGIFAASAASMWMVEKK